MDPTSETNPIGTFRVLLVGAGSISRAWIQPLIDHPHVQLVGMVDIDLEQAQKRAAEFDLTDLALGSELTHMIHATSADLVCDCTVPSAHAEITRTALANGCHVLGEKPLDVSMESARTTLDVVAQSGRTYAVMQNRRYHEGIRRMAAAIASGAIGALTTLNADFYIAPHFGGFRERMEHILLVDMAIHSFDQARFLSGADPQRVYCHEWTPAGSWFQHGASAVAIFEMSQGIVFTYRGSWVAQGFPTSWECEWRAVGTEGTLFWDGAELLRGERVSGDKGFIHPVRPIKVPKPTPLLHTGHAGCIYEMLDAIREGRKSQTDCRDNIKSLAMVWGAVESASRGERVEIQGIM